MHKALKSVFINHCRGLIGKTKRAWKSICNAEMQGIVVGVVLLLFSLECVKECGHDPVSNT